MSVKVMGMVFDRYPNGGGEMLLALALADHAEHDGTSIFPSVAKLAEKTRQSERSVQYQLRKMEKIGWLQLVDGSLGYRKTREYRINPDWIKGANIAPIPQKTEAEMGATDDMKWVQSTTEMGAIAVAPEPSLEPSLEPSVAKHSTKQKKPGQATLSTFLRDCQSRGEKPIPPTDRVFKHADQVGLDHEMVAVAWHQLKAKYLDTGKKYTSWRKAFQNCVRENWFNLWWLDSDGNVQWTSKGQQARKAMKAEQREAETA